MNRSLTFFFTLMFLLIMNVNCSSKTQRLGVQTSSNSVTPPVAPTPNPPGPTPTPCVITENLSPQYNKMADYYKPPQEVSLYALERGIGLDIQRMYWNQSKYIDRRAGFVNKVHIIDFTADPFALSGGPDKLDLLRADVRAAFNRRYGPAPEGQLTESSCGHETASIWWDAAEWKFRKDPTAITPNPAAYDGVLTLKEKTDLVFTCRLEWIYEQCAVEGHCNPENPIQISDPDKPCGKYQEKNWFWGYMDWYENTHPKCSRTCPK